MALNAADQCALIARLTEYLADRRGEIVKVWLDRVCSDARIVSTDRLSRPALVDHVPALIDGIIQSLRDTEAQEVSPNGEEDAKDHGIQRSQQGYQLEELVREFTQLR